VNRSSRSPRSHFGSATSERSVPKFDPGTPGGRARLEPRARLDRRALLIDDLAGSLTFSHAAVRVVLRRDASAEQRASQDF
jgi:hypothetical protein